MLAGTRISREFVSQDSGLRTVVWQQELDGVPLFQCVLIAHMTGQGELVSLSSQFVPDPDNASQMNIITRSALVAVPPREPRPALGEAFWLNVQAPRTWARTFSVWP